MFPEFLFQKIVHGLRLIVVCYIKLINVIIVGVSSEYCPNPFFSIKITDPIYPDSYKPDSELLDLFQFRQAFERIQKNLLCNILCVHASAGAVIDHAEDIFVKQIHKLLKC